MSGLVDKNGHPISSAQFKKEAPPKLGEAFAPWAGRDLVFDQLPGGSLVQFDLSKLRLEDYRVMRDHYQVNASLAVLSFIQHQAEWHIECEDKKIAAAVEEQLVDIWTPLNRSLATANWAGYSPNALDWENDPIKGQVRITKVKDLAPEECEVHWDTVEGWAPPGRVRPKYKVYGGIDYAPQRGWPIPIENSFWYPLLMENGNYYGRKLLRPAFQSWFFSILVHLFANRYFERFGEPVPIGRAPFDDELEIGREKVKGNTYLLKVLQDLRNRSVVVLPNDRTQVGNNGQMSFDYEIEYLESQMRGADFERYLTRLDEEISIGLFTPILMLRTADVGSYNLGVGHMQVYQWMLNALNDDRATYIDKYIINKFINYNFSIRAPRAKIVFRKMGNTDTDLIKQVLVSLISGGKVEVDLDELGKLAGLSLKEIKELTQPTDPAQDPASDPADAAGGNQSAARMPNAYSVVTEIRDRVAVQVQKHFSNHTFGEGTQINMGFKNRLCRTVEREPEASIYKSTDAVERFYARMDAWLEDVVALGEDEFSGPDSFMHYFSNVMNVEFEELVRRAAAD